MNYLALIWADGRPSKEDLAVMQRELPIWETEASRVRLFGRELELPAEAVTVSVRDGETVVSDGPFAETKEFIAGFDLLECADREQAVAFAADCPISRFQPIEVRRFADGLQVDDRAHAFGRGEDGDALPFLLAPWVTDAGSREELSAWRGQLQDRGVHILGHALDGPETATTVRGRDAAQTITSGPFTTIPEFVPAIDVVSCADRAEAVELAATHPLAREHAIEVRPFYVG